MIWCHVIFQYLYIIVANCLVLLVSRLFHGISSSSISTDRSPFVTRRSYHLGSSVLFCSKYKIFAVMIEYHWFKTEKIFQSRMLTSSKKSSLVPDFLFSLLQLFTRVTVHSARYLLHLNTLLVSVCSKDLLICFADHWRGE